jgi:hypothetical protein
VGAAGAGAGEARAGASKAGAMRPGPGRPGAAPVGASRAQPRHGVAGFVGSGLIEEYKVPSYIHWSINVHKLCILVFKLRNIF